MVLITTLPPGTPQPKQKMYPSGQTTAFMTDSFEGSARHCKFRKLGWTYFQHSSPPHEWPLRITAKYNL